MSEIERVKNIIKKLSSKKVENGCTESEAMLAINKIGELLEQYNLSIADCFMDEFQGKLIKIPARKHFVGVAVAVVSIANFCDTIVYRWGDYYCWYGNESDVEMAVYLYEMIDSSIHSELRKFKATELYQNSRRKRAASNSFMSGMGNRIAARLDDMKDQMNSNLMAKTGTDIVVHKMAKIEEELFTSHGVKVKYGKRSLGRGDYNAFSAGVKAGNTVNLNRPVGNEGVRLLA